MDSLLQLGHLVRIELRSGHEISPRGKILAWGGDGRAGELFICKKVKGKAAELPASIRRQHRQFHGADPEKTVLAEVPEPYGNPEKVGLIKAVTYRPVGIKSPSKKTYNWRHVFGDTGHEGKEGFPSSCMPALYRDKKGNLYIKRRSKNTFYVGMYSDGYAWIIA